jgi:hypothetical protein
VAKVAGALAGDKERAGRQEAAMARKLRKVDVRQAHPELYRAARKVEEVNAGRAAFLAADGVGEPGGGTYQEAIGKLYALAYTTKFSMKHAGTLDFAVPNLECLWFDDPTAKPMSQWRWRLLLRIPEEVTGQDLQRARKVLRDRKGADVSGVRRRTWTEGRAAQVLHVGPYETVNQSYKALQAYAGEHGLRCIAPGHEVYLNDPRRTLPERLKTIVRMPVRRARRRT